MAKPLILGLSHIYGECIDLDLTTKFWKQKNLSYQEFQLPVTAEKSALFSSTPASETTLRYFKTQGPGFEFLEHRPKASRSLSSRPLISVFFFGITASTTEDPDHNFVTYDPSLKVPMTLKIRVRSLSESVLLFEKLQFSSTQMTEDEAVLLEVDPLSPAFKVEPPLFPQMRCRIVLVEDASVEAAPPIDRPGFSGLSFVVPSLEEIETVVPLKAHQNFEDPLSQKRVGFSNEFGVLVEFLEVLKRKLP